ncbi:MAG TPA: hypothetical protein VMD59_06320 [Acidimicrobiales bacterium]|nr:hypothetical protein [Acidimicrobiales bacterium]
MAVLHLAKYEGLGNDFLVLRLGIDDVEGRSGAVAVVGQSGPAGGSVTAANPIDATIAAALCDRHRGPGADGVITLAATAEGGVRMTLRNADGGLAETSGNGLRCAALAAIDGGLASGPELVIETGAGPASARLLARHGSAGATVRVSMGEARLGEGRHGILERFARIVDTGNPHLVLHPERGGPVPMALRAEDLAHLEHGVDGELAGGVNVEAVVVESPGVGSPGVGGLAPGADAPSAGSSGGGALSGQPDRIELVVWERGAGATLACGSGSVAAAAACRAAGLVGDRVEVHNPGGVLLVELSGPPEAPSAYLTGPARLVARIEVDLDWMLDAALGEAAPRDPAGAFDNQGALENQGALDPAGARDPAGALDNQGALDLAPARAGEVARAS